jgi:D-alanyl-D-alanine carboxypeptidase
VNPSLILLADEFAICADALVARGLHACAEASCLEVAEVAADGREHLLIEQAAAAWRALKAAARDDGISLFIVSSFRSIERQAQIIRRKLAAGQSIEDVLKVCAPPGFSEHHSGRAVDVSTPGVPVLTVEFEQTAAFAWLAAHAAVFGFLLSYPCGNAQGFLYEPWHWCFHGAQAGDL